MARRPHFLAPLTQPTGGQEWLFADGTIEPIATRVTPAFDSASRRQGLLGRAALGDDEALAIAPCSAVHTFGMQFAIDLLFADRDGKVIKVREALRPNRISAGWGAFAVIEVASGTIARTGLKPGRRLELRRAG